MIPFICTKRRVIPFIFTLDLVFLDLVCLWNNFGKEARDVVDMPPEAVKLPWPLLSAPSVVLW
ncbi:MAG: hypothetical protein IPO53_13700 [Chitinophagaceae bacterium]|nr:hypothetical protein [Chitinophagaceae bacterium]